jgi:hypothetical protein
MSELAVIAPEKFNLTKISWDDVQAPDSFESALALLEGNGVTVDTAAVVMPDEFPEIEKKDLVNVPVMLLTWNISNPERGEFEGQYIVVRGITRAGKRFRFSDGSTGIFQQLRKLTGVRIQQGYSTPNAGLIVEKGLVKSDYTFTDDKGKPTNATTFYLANE